MASPGNNELRGCLKNNGLTLALKQDYLKRTLRFISQFDKHFKPIYFLDFIMTFDNMSALAYVVMPFTTSLIYCR